MSEASEHERFIVTAGLHEASDHTRGVFRALRDAITDKEFAGLTAELPGEFAAALA